jgi:hypothetical protein
MLACIEAGAAGEYIEEQLRPKGLCFGHEPDSYEFRCVITTEGEEEEITNDILKYYGRVDCYKGKWDEEECVRQY